MANAKQYLTVSVPAHLCNIKVKDPHPSMCKPRLSGLGCVELSSSLTWKDLMKVHSKVRIPSPRERSFTSLITRNSRKKVMEILALSSEVCSTFF